MLTQGQRDSRPAVQLHRLPAAAPAGELRAAGGGQAEAGHVARPAQRLPHFRHPASGTVLVGI